MKPVSKVKACVVDYGYYIELANRLSFDMESVSYHSPTDSEYQDVKHCVQGDGISGVKRIREFFSPEIINATDLFVFPDIGYSGAQRQLREMGKAVWGSFDGTEYEIYRTKFLELLKEIGLSSVPSIKIVGLDNLSEHLKSVKDKWVKVNRFRGNMETWKHIDYDHSLDKLNELRIEFGGVSDYITFVVQDDIKSEVETGYDGWSIDGQYPSKCFHGYEDKNELYLSAMVNYNELPGQLLEVNDSLKPLFEKIKYRNWCASEIRIKDGIPYFIDPTFRMPGMSGEHQLETCANISEVIWAGANGVLIEPEFTHKFACSATLHHSGGNGWVTMSIPEEARKWIKLNHYCEAGGQYRFPPRCNDEVGVVIGVGQTIMECLNHLKENFELLEKEPVSILFENFAGLLREAKEAEDEGIPFNSQTIPKPEVAIQA